MPIHRYVLEVEGLEYWLHETTDERASLLHALIPTAKTIVAMRAVSEEQFEPYAIVSWSCDMRPLTWAEFVASGIKAKVKGLEAWVDAKPGTQVAPRLTEEELSPPRDDEPEEAKAAVHPKSKQNYTEKLLGVLTADPTTSERDMAIAVYGDSSAPNISRIRYTLQYLKKKGKIRPVLSGGYQLIAA